MIKLSKTIKAITDNAVELLFPLRCPVCDRPVPLKDKENGICSACIKNVPLIKGSMCLKCGRKMVNPGDHIMCADCEKRGSSFAYDRGLALFEYNDTVRKMIYRFKYGGRREYGDALGRLLTRRYKKILVRAKADGIIAVPLHEERFKKRGYNQAELLAKPLSEGCGIPYYPDYVIRTKNTVAMKTLSGQKRQNNLKKAFKIGQNDVKLDRVVIVDDIYTTGATVNAVARTLKEAGCKKVYFIALSIGEG